MTAKRTPAVTLVLYLVTFAVRSANSQCPTGCECPNRSDQDFRTISCIGLGLDDLPNFPEEVSDLTIAYGAISEIPPGYFSLPSLTDLNLSNNDLETISKESFEYVGSLQNIDLSMNPIVCNKKIDWLQIWRESYPRNKVIGNCTNGNTISNYLDGITGEVLEITLGSDDLTFDRTCESLYIAATVRPAATSAMTYRFTYLPEEGSEGDLEIDDKVIFPAGADSMVIQVRVKDGGSAGDPQRSYLLVLLPKSITAVGTEMKIILDDGVSTCSTVQTTVSPSTMPTTDRPKPTTTLKPPPVPIPPWLLALIVILILLIILFIVGVIVYCTCYKEEKVAESANPTVAYSPVGEKVYNPTTEEQDV